MSTPAQKGSATESPTTSTAQRHVAQSAPPSGASAGSTAPTEPLTKPQRILMELTKLVPHPLQQAYNPSCSPAEDAQLESDLKTGQREPIHVMPAGNRAGLPTNTILDGHRRADALRRLGRTQAIVVIRHDLRDADASAVEEIFLRFNQNRRQLDPLAITKNLKRQMELAPRHGLDHDDLQQLAKKISDIIGGMSLRNAQRYIHAADAVPEIQAAFRRGDITLTLTAQIGSLNDDVQQDIVAAINGITGRAEIRTIVLTRVRKCSASRQERPTWYTPKAVRLARHLQEDLAELAGRYDKIHGPTLAPYLPVLLAAQEALPKLIRAAKRPGSSLLQDLMPGSPDTVSDAADLPKK